MLASENTTPIVDAPEDVQQPLESEEKAYRTTRNDFYANLLTLCQLGATQSMGKNTFATRAKSLVRQAHELAFIDGLRVGAGNNSVMPDSDEQVALKSLITFQLSRIRDLSNFVFDDPVPSFSEVDSRVGLWVNKGLDTSYNEGLMLGRGNKMMKWQVGNTKHSCKTCQTANGQIHRAKEWKRVGIYPKSDKCLCNGFQCKCEFEPTTEKAQGRLWRIPTKNKVLTTIKTLLGYDTHKH
jgi:hypothetical protein